MALTKEFMTGWEEAMKWWHELWETDKQMFHYIRNVAVARLEEDWPEGQGISSSDTNHAVYEMYQDYKRVKDMDEYKGRSLLIFLRDYINKTI